MARPSSFSFPTAPPGPSSCSAVRVVVGLAATCAGASACLVTDPPLFTPPVTTAPYLSPIGADPDPGTPVVFDDQGHASLLRAFTRTFSALVTSQDDLNTSSTFARVFPRLYVDYGSGSSDKPYDSFVDGDALPANRFGQPERTEVDYPAYALGLSHGCHTVTLMVAHNFAGGAPSCPTYCRDFSLMTWVTLLCDSTSGDPKQSCDAIDLASCPTQAFACPSVPSPSAADGGGAATVTCREPSMAAP